ncbi:MAG: class I SAM-dependent methyltransferase [Candidatus Gastranaerophilaceae bacterium]|jgi:hypothetical protein
MNYEDILEYLKNEKIQKKIDQLVQKYKNQKVLIYGSGTFFNVLHENFDLSKLNIIAISDKKFQQNGEYKGLKAVPVSEIKNLSFDVLIIATFEPAILEVRLQEDLYPECGKFKIDFFSDYINNDTLTHYQILKLLHEKLKPKTYLEIGMNKGLSIILADEKTQVIGIDPSNSIIFQLDKNIKPFFATSDEFFKKNDLQKILGEQKLDMAFIDGMHLFEFVLRDFINVEKNCHKNSVVLLHDTIPFDALSSSRERQTILWTGDVFKIILALKKYRPDLEIYNFSTPPIGTCLVKNLNPNTSVLEENYNKIVEEYINLTFDDIQKNLKENLFIIEADLEKICELSL